MNPVFSIRFFPGYCALCARFDHLAPVEGATTPLEREGLVYLCPLCISRHYHRAWQARAARQSPTT